jgi:hypothetical protein
MISDILQKFDSRSLDELENLDLLDRMDVKYVAHEELLSPLLEKVREHYAVLEVDGKRQARYKNVYYDDPSFIFYREHHRGKAKRFKIRNRWYEDSQVGFFEIKRKGNKGITEKFRIPIKSWNEVPNGSASKLVNEVVTVPHGELNQGLGISFERITLLHHQNEDRCTIDTDLEFHYDGETKSFPGLMLLEVKQKKYSRAGDFVQALESLGVRNQRISKYCLGINAFFPELKMNLFKPRHLAIGRVLNPIV